MPRVLVFMATPFINDHGTEIQHMQIQIIPSLQIDFSGTKYTYRAHICKSGSANAGHYICYVSIEEELYRLDDDRDPEHVKEIREADQPYLFFYERND